MRGEKQGSVELASCRDGSSPRAWEKVPGWKKSRGALRIIPTCVGKSHYAGRLADTKPDHPHVRGEKTPGPHCVSFRVGSSPRAWGKVIAKNPNKYA